MTFSERYISPSLSRIYFTAGSTKTLLNPLLGRTIVAAELPLKNIFRMMSIKINADALSIVVFKVPTTSILQNLSIDSFVCLLFSNQSRTD